MAGRSVDALVEDILAAVPNHQPEMLRDEAINLALNMLLESSEITALLTELEVRTGAKLERRGQPRTFRPFSRRYRF